MNKEKFVVKNTYTAKDVLRSLNDLAIVNAALFVINEKGIILGTVTDGDIRRGLLRELTISDPVEKFMNSNFHSLTDGGDFKSKFEFFRREKIRFIPVLDASKKLVRLIDTESVKSFLPVDAIIMAGGRGERLRPLTDDTPKPMLKIGDKPILEHNIDRLINFGVSDFHITINYLGNKIESHFGNGKSKQVNINYVNEEEPLGTIGAAGMIKYFKNDTILLMNSDLLTNIDYEDFYNKFKSTLADMAVATVPYSVNVPYAVMDIDSNDSVSGFREKPVYTYYSNAGIYFIKKEMLKYIPQNKKFDATDLMELIISKGKKIISYPIIAYWLDIGKMEDYKKAQEDVKHLKL